MNKILSAVNGKKLPIAAITFVIMSAVAYGELKSTVATNTRMIEELKPVTTEVTTQVATIKANVENIDEKMDELQLEQRIIRDDIKLILQKVSR